MVNVIVRQSELAINKFEIYIKLLKNALNRFFCKKYISADLGRRDVLYDIWFQIHVTDELKYPKFDFEV